MATLDVMKEDPLTIAEAAVLLPGVAEITLRGWVRTGFRGIKLESVRIGARILTTKQAMARFIAATTEQSDREWAATRGPLRQTAIPAGPTGELCAAADQDGD